MRALAKTLFLLLALVVSACGQKGPLYLPEVPEEGSEQGAENTQEERT